MKDPKMMKTNSFPRILFRLLFVSVAIASFSGCNEKEIKPIANTLRAPAYPLITIDPYTNGWVFGDTLYNSPVNHYNGRKFPLIGIIRVDGKCYRFLGVEDNSITELVAPIAEQGAWDARYTFDQPSGNWKDINYNDNQWAKGKGAFGYFSQNRFESVLRTPWKTDNIWVRREVILDKDLSGNDVFLEFKNDDDAIIYINGIEAVSRDYAMNEKIKLPEEIVATLKKGKNVIAAHCVNNIRNAIIDFGLSVSHPVNKIVQKSAVQKSVNVQPTQTIYTFACGEVNLKLEFMAPMLMDDLDLLSRPVNYITYEVISNDSKAHEVELYFEAGTEWALSHDFQESVSEYFEKDDLVFLKTGSVSQNILARPSSPYINWGYFYLSAKKENTYTAIGDHTELRKTFCEQGIVQHAKNPLDKQNRLALSRKLGKVNKAKSGYIMLGYDDIYSIQYFGQNLRPYWNRQGNKNILQMFDLADSEYEKVKKACNKFDAELMNYAFECGGREYAELCALAYRQTLSAHKLLMTPNNELLFLSSSVLLTATVDVTYPTAPLFLLYNVDLLKGLLNPIFYYAKSDKWSKPYAPHDIGTYPHANGQVFDMDMPVEESGNMLILTAAIATMEGNALYAERHWDILSQWADYLLSEGFDPENQTNTDCFTAPSAHNANLSIKAILGIASYARLADMLGKNKIAKKYSSKARSMALEWTKLADDGDHYRFAFDQPDTWSQKYNLVWDKIMKIDVFPHEIREKEVKYYLAKQNEFGLPLDSRHSYTKADWIVWTATLSPNLETFQQFIAPLYRYVNETPVRVPMSDWYWTEEPTIVGFQARPVVGGYFIKMMEDKLVNK
jgi:hypothetical protein